MILPEALRILVVDDNEYARAIALAMLVKVGVRESVQVSTGAEAVERLLTEDFDVLLTDWYMPEISGSGLIRIVRSRGFGQNRLIPVVLMTAYATRENIGMARALGINEILIKPFEAPALAAALTRAANSGAAESFDQQVFLGDL